jgi:glycosyltransferase involved in cell wall biosynthesis
MASCPHCPPRVAVVLPAYRAADTLAAALRSVQAQTERDWELVVVDDGSDDGTWSILATFARRDPRIRPLRHRANQGIVPALETALRAVTAPLVARLDADDICRPERLAKQADFLDVHPEIGLVACQVEFGGDREKQAGYALHVDWTNSLTTPGEIRLNRFVESPFAHPSVMFRRDLVNRFGGYRDGPFPEDYELWLRWLDAGVAMAKLPEKLVVWNDPPGRLSRTDQRYSFQAFYETKATYLARWLARHNPHHPDVVVWGAGRETRKRAEHLVRHGICITHYVDIDPRKIGQRIHGRPVLGEDQLPRPEEAFVVSYVGSRGAREDIRLRLATRGFREGVHFAMGA